MTTNTCPHCGLPLAGTAPDAARGESLSELERAVVEAAREVVKHYLRYSWAVDGKEGILLLRAQIRAVRKMDAARAAASAAQGERR